MDFILLPINHFGSIQRKRRDTGNEIVAWIYSTQMIFFSL